MVASENSPCVKGNIINLRLLPIKLHFFFAYGAMAGVVPFLSVFARDLGINATAVGIVYTVLPFTVMFAKPIFGMAADYFRNIKVVIICIMIISSVGYFSILFIPPLDNQSNSTSSFFVTHCQGNSTVPENLTHNSCLDTVELNSTNCDFYSNICLILHEAGNISDICNNNRFSTSEHFLKSEANKNFVSNLSSCSCNNLISFLNATNSCFFKDNGNTKNVYTSSQFWIFALLAIIAGSCSASLFSLSDAACYEVIDDSQLYGKQRLWATISWGSITLLTGYLNDNASSFFNANNNYAPGFYLMIILVVIDLMVLLRVTLIKSNSSSHIWKDVSRIFSSQETIVFSVGTYLIGAFTALLWQYQFWFLQELGANQLLLGINVATQCIIAEVPFFFLSGKIIAYFGHMNCLIASFAAFALRYGLYFVIENPWLVLPVEILHGQSFGVFYATMTSYANSKAPAGTEATMIGILSGLFEGLGLATGSLLGGVGVDKLDARHTFLIGSIISAICFLCFSFVQLTFKRRWKTIQIP